MTKIYTICALVLFSSLPAWAIDPSSSTVSQTTPKQVAALSTAPLIGAESPIRLVAGTQVSVHTLENVTSFYDEPGRLIPLAVSEDVVVDGRVAIPRGTLMHAVVASREKGGSFGAGGVITLNPQDYILPNGQHIAFIGSVAANGKRKGTVGLATNIALAGIVGGFLSKGKEGFMPLGTNFVLATAYEVHMSPVSYPVVTSCPDGRSVSAMQPKTYSFATTKRKELPFVSVLLLQKDISDLQMVCVNKEPLGQFVPARGASGQAFVFDGWDILKSLPVISKKKGQSFQLRFAGKDSNGETVVADVNFPVTVK